MSLHIMFIFTLQKEKKNWLSLVQKNNIQEMQCKAKMRRIATTRNNPQHESALSTKQRFSQQHGNLISRQSAQLGHNSNIADGSNPN